MQSIVRFLQVRAAFAESRKGTARERTGRDETCHFFTRGKSEVDQDIHHTQSERAREQATQEVSVESTTSSTLRNDKLNSHSISC